MTPENLLAHFNCIADAPDAIPRLRRFILDLAVRGKLVEQDPNDEPAAELLKRITAEKEQLVAEKKIKKPKALPPIDAGELPFEIPDGWKWVLFGEVFDIQGGTQPPKSKFVDQPQDGYVRLVQIRDLGDKPVPTYVPKSECRRFCSNKDIMIGRYGASVGKVFWGIDGAYNVALVKFCYDETLWNGDFAFRLLKSSIFQNPLLDASRSAQAGFNKTDLAPIPFPLPPLAEQKRIVAKVTELMALCDRLEAAQAEGNKQRKRLVAATHHQINLPDGKADTTDAHTTDIASFLFHPSTFKLHTSRPQDVSLLRQTILNLAVRGKLVPQDPNDEPAAELLKRIAAEKERLVAEKKIKKTKPCRVIESDETPYQVPATWCWAMLDSLSDIGTGSTPKRTIPEYWKNGSIPWVTSGATRDNQILHGSELVTKLATEDHRLRLYPQGTLLIALYGQGKTRGQVAKLCIQATINQALAAICPVGENGKVLDYIDLLLRKKYHELREQAAGGAQPNLNVQKIKETLVPLPPLAEQKRIVAKVDELMALCDALEAQLTTSQSESQQLLEACLNEAIA